MNVRQQTHFKYVAEEDELNIDGLNQTGRDWTVDRGCRCQNEHDLHG